MSDETLATIKTVVGVLIRWSMKFVGGFLAISGISQDSFEEVAIGLVTFGIGAVISLIMRKKDINTPVPE